MSHQPSKDASIAEAYYKIGCLRDELKVANDLVAELQRDAERTQRRLIETQAERDEARAEAVRESAYKEQKMHRMAMQLTDYEGRVAKVEAERDEARAKLAEVEKHTLSEVEIRTKTVVQMAAVFEKTRNDALRERDEARKSLARMNRRAQAAEGILARSGVIEGRPQTGSHGRSFGRILANYAAASAKRERDEARAKLREIEHLYALADMNLGAQLAKAKDQLAELREAKDAAYRERDMLVAALSKVFSSYLGRHPEDDTAWDADWRWIVYVELPTGQASWHIHDSERPWFSHLAVREDAAWDGHTTEEKYRRLAKLRAEQGGEDTHGS